MMTLLWVFMVLLVAIYCYIGARSREYNNYMLYGILVVTIIALSVAVSRGFGDPLVVKALQSVGKAEPSSVAKQYAGFVNGIAGEELVQVATETQEKDGKGKGWFWWKLFIFFFVSTIIFVPFAFWDEFESAYWKARERWEQEEAIIDLLPPPDQIQSPAVQAQVTTQQPSEKGLKGFFRHIFVKMTDNLGDAFIAEVVVDSIRNVGKRLMFKV
ncbi:MAG: hypothetical protein AAB503_01230 [Patescibacteria group bacterium]